MKKLTTFLLCLSLALTAALPAAAGEVPAMQTGTGTTAIGMPNPITDCKDAQEAAAITGFPFTLPEPPAGYTGPAVSVLDRQMAQAIFRNEAGQTLTFRKEAGSADISGDYNVYPEVVTMEGPDGCTLTLKGENGRYHLAIWTLDGYSYSVHSEEGMEAAAAAGFADAMTEAGTEIPNLFTEYDRLSDAEEAAGFPVSAPASVPGNDSRILCVGAGMIEILYQNGEETAAVIRKSAGDEDNSGDYAAYPEEKTIRSGGRTVTLKGEDGLYTLAVWSEGGYAYSVRAEGLTQAEMTALVRRVR